MKTIKYIMDQVKRRSREIRKEIEMYESQRSKATPQVTKRSIMAANVFHDAAKDLRRIMWRLHLMQYDCRGAAEEILDTLREPYAQLCDAQHLLRKYEKVEMVGDLPELIGLLAQDGWKLILACEYVIDNATDIKKDFYYLTQKDAVPEEDFCEECRIRQLKAVRPVECFEEEVYE